ncbi:MAG: ATP-binding protein [Fibrobacter sp.]|nr:ATP-binding protein [Fibrobacter sp.]
MPVTGNLLNRRIKLTRFPQLKTIEDFDFEFNTTIKKKDVLALCTSNFIFKNHNILL